MGGQNGILTKASEASKKTKQASEEEKLQLEIAGAFDNNGNIIDTSPFVPEGAVVTNSDISTGITIKDRNENEWTWVVVPKSITASANTQTEIETALENYTKDVVTSRNGYTDTYYAGCGYADEKAYNTAKETMLNSIKSNGGFYIGKYEVGIKENTVRNFGGDYNTEHSTEGQTAVIQKDKYPYNWVRQSQAQELSVGLSTGGKTSTLMFGIQWDLVLKYLNVSGEKSVADLTSDSSSWGNYSNVSFNVTSGSYSTNYEANWIVATEYTKPASTVLLTTGATDRNGVLNIYDLAGNVLEWTLEKASNSGGICTNRGGTYNSHGSDYPASYRGINGTNIGSTSIVGFRSTLY